MTGIVREAKMSQIKNFAVRATCRKVSEEAVEVENAWNRYGRVAALIACIAGAVYLALGDHEGWGWLIFLALVLA
jgi:hypothetical protein